MHNSVQLWALFAIAIPPLNTEHILIKSVKSGKYIAWWWNLTTNYIKLHWHWSWAQHYLGLFLVSLGLRACSITSSPRSSGDVFPVLGPRPGTACEEVWM